ncbi:molybdate ABC transporter substrate-binding protein [Methylicorpusculum sp.]|uniref:molybdate ABC transporter substrate-binding protein n=1 Tax=Methylicorpusculum sp. TaxID=2713644 RepID=UPI00271CE4E8|nr:molybdate ABC transporter substrate-binding protein [Methylicorpusculum sp.]MDO9241325.1 molybdate ABC transporter substrate-binding protein [Methylicorpusculum sp.]MDP2179140.1 molybdate ABC transporter substrate-binding protein [Methylicorpusculum sp.]MDP3531393.1 molybdate ABC transporter substrate-binding protein [Methylicorpusculum sp.]MDZ4150227.1 molybdate ABC transporter substrate-binding protein [Methylicorpusculum sp.]
MRIKLFMLLVIYFFYNPSQAATVNVAVAANFSGPMQKIASAFDQSTGHKTIIAYGTVGKFYAQIKSGAPFDLLISADQETPEQLEKDNLAVAESRFTYAIGKLVLWSSRPGFVDEHGDILKKDDFKHIAIANPKVAVYGEAAIEALNKLGLTQQLQARFVTGENITQAYQFVSSGNAELGFIAWSQIYEEGRAIPGSYWLVPQDLYPSLRQDAVLLTRGKDNVAAKDLLAFLRSDTAKNIIRSYGYDN